MGKIDINLIINMAKNNKVRWTNHVIIRLFQRNISQEDEIIEEYESDYPYPSCLICGLSLDNKFLHIVCGLTNQELWIITSYYPSSNEWENNFKIRKEKK